MLIPLNFIFHMRKLKLNQMNNIYKSQILILLQCLSREFLKHLRKGIKYNDFSFVLPFIFLFKHVRGERKLCKGKKNLDIFFVTV